MRSASAAVAPGNDMGALIVTPLIDTPPPPPPRELFAAPPVRDRGTGRPTKKERRETDRLLGRRK